MSNKHMEKIPVPTNPKSEEEIAKWREEHKDQLGKIPQFRQAPDGTLMREDNDGKLNPEELEVINEENKDISL